LAKSLLKKVPLSSFTLGGGHYKDLPPHIYAIAAEAFKCLFENQKNQAIVISGESGAGKTENAKFCMNLLTSIGTKLSFLP
jgi:myosin heavy subunit